MCVYNYDKSHSEKSLKQVFFFLLRVRVSLAGSLVGGMLARCTRGPRLESRLDGWCIWFVLPCDIEVYNKYSGL